MCGPVVQCFWRWRNGLSQPADAVDDPSADAQPDGTPSGTNGNPSQEPPVAAVAPEGSEDENRKPEAGDHGGKHPLRAQPEKMTSGRVERRQLSPRAAIARFPSGRVLRQRVLSRNLQGRKSLEFIAHALQNNSATSACFSPNQHELSMPGMPAVGLSKSRLCHNIRDCDARVLSH